MMKDKTEAVVAGVIESDNPKGHTGDDRGYPSFAESYVSHAVESALTIHRVLLQALSQFLSLAPLLLLGLNVDAVVCNQLLHKGEHTVAVTTLAVFLSLFIENPDGCILVKRAAILIVNRASSERIMFSQV